jgi:phosphoribosyl 1,2-cyclic phosphate phosphodiesterase
MQLKYLGTGASEGFPALFCKCAACQRAQRLGGKNIKRRSCAMIDEKVLIDISPDLYMQKLAFNLDLSKVESLIVTHSHEDHFDIFSLMLRGKPNYCRMNHSGNRDMKLQVYGNEAVERLFYQGVNHKLGGSLAMLNFNQVTEFRPFTASGLQITPLLANHKKDEKCFIYLIENNARRILYANDTDAIDDINYTKINGLKLDVVSMDCARGQYPGDGHMGLNENLFMRKALAMHNCIHSGTRFILTHLSHMCNQIHDELAAEAAKFDFELAYDGMDVFI